MHYDVNFCFTCRILSSGKLWLKCIFTHDNHFCKMKIKLTVVINSLRRKEIRHKISLCYFHAWKTSILKYVFRVLLYLCFIKVWFSWIPLMLFRSNICFVPLLCLDIALLRLLSKQKSKNIEILTLHLGSIIHC